MKNTKKIKMAELLALAFMLPSAALAQASGSHGGGEDGVFKDIRDEVGVWMQRNLKINQLDAKLELTTDSGSLLYTSFEKAAKDVADKVIFNHDVIKFGDNIRICKNENKVITCNLEEWANTHGNTRYMIVLHEYLGIAGIETNTEKDYSRYPISPKILAFVHSREAFELGMEKTLTPVNYDDVKLDFGTIFSATNQKKMNELTQKKYSIPFQFLSQPSLINTSEDTSSRTYRISVLSESETTGTSYTTLHCTLEVGLKFYSPLKEWQKQMQDQQMLQEQQRQTQLSQQRPQPASQQTQNTKPVALQQNDEQVFQIAEQHNQQRLQEDQQRDQQAQQQRQQQQLQQQQAQAPIPTAASMIVDMSVQCQFKKGKGFFLTNKELHHTKLYKFAKKHSMLDSSSWMDSSWKNDY